MAALTTLTPSTMALKKSSKESTERPRKRQRRSMPTWNDTIDKFLWASASEAILLRCPKQPMIRDLSMTRAKFTQYSHKWAAKKRIRQGTVLEQLMIDMISRWSARVYSTGRVEDQPVICQTTVKTCEYLKREFRRSHRPTVAADYTTTRESRIKNPVACQDLANMILSIPFPCKVNWNSSSREEAQWKGQVRWGRPVARSPSPNTQA